MGALGASFDACSSVNFRNKSVENLLISSHEVISSINSSSLVGQNSATNLSNAVAALDNQIQESPVGSAVDRNSPVSSPNLSPRPSPRAHSRREYSRVNSDSSAKDLLRGNKSEDQLSQVYLHFALQYFHEALLAQDRVTCIVCVYDIYLIIIFFSKCIGSDKQIV